MLTRGGVTILRFSGVARNPATVQQTAMQPHEKEFHAPQNEAAIFYGMFLRGHSADSLRRQIDISPNVFQKWMRAQEYDRNFREQLRRMYVYRKRVLAIFDSLVTSEESRRAWQ